MTPSLVDQRVVADRLNAVDEMVAMVRRLPLDDDDSLRSDDRNLATIESCVRRSLEALFDVGRHILAKGFGKGVVEYRGIAELLGHEGVLTTAEAALLSLMAGYRNRLVHMYHDVGDDELIEIARERLADLETVSHAYRKWMSSNPARITRNL